jgi:hypothetical protein
VLGAGSIIDDIRLPFPDTFGRAARDTPSFRARQELRVLGMLRQGLTNLDRTVPLSVEGPRISKQMGALSLGLEPFGAMMF